MITVLGMAMSVVQVVDVVFVLYGLVPAALAVAMVVLGVLLVFGLPLRHVISLPRPRAGVRRQTVPGGHLHQLHTSFSGIHV
jgi:hypothetical protein